MITKKQKIDLHVAKLAMESSLRIAPNLDNLIKSSALPVPRRGILKKAKKVTILSPDTFPQKSKPKQKKHVSFNIKPTTPTEIYEDDDVGQYLESIVLQNRSLVLVKNHKLLLRQDHSSMIYTVKILSGGAARLEPLLSGFVGPGILTASILGELTSSPPYFKILSALRMLSRHHHEGVLVIVMNNTADRLNFGLACQEAAQEGIKTMCLIVGEDCSGVHANPHTGRKGLCGIVFFYKIAGAMAEDNKSLYEIFCVLTALNGGSIGTIDIGIEDNNMTIGTGLKGEPGMFVSKVKSITEVVKEALFYVFHPASDFSLPLVKGDKIAVIVNNLGKMSDFHLNLIVKEVMDQITFLGVNVSRLYSGRFLSSEAPPGFSISVLKITSDILNWLDYPVNVIDWPYGVNKATEISIPYKEQCLFYVDRTFYYSYSDFRAAIRKKKRIGPRFTGKQAFQVAAIIHSISKSILSMETHLNDLDWDQNYGTTVKKFVYKVKSEMELEVLHLLTPFGLLNHLAELAVTTIDGALGAVFSVLLCSAAQSFESWPSKTPVSWNMWMDAARMARDALCTYIHVQPGNKTILDALNPFVETFRTPSVEGLSGAVHAAVIGTENTKHWLMEPDPGAYALIVALKIILHELSKDIDESAEYDSNDNI